MVYALRLVPDDCAEAEAGRRAGCTLTQLKMATVDKRVVVVGGVRKNIRVEHTDGS